MWYTVLAFYSDWAVRKELCGVAGVSSRPASLSFFVSAISCIPGPFSTGGQDHRLPHLMQHPAAFRSILMTFFNKNQKHCLKPFQGALEHFQKAVGGGRMWLTWLS